MKNVKINLNDKVLTSPAGQQYAFDVKSGATLTITGKGSIVNEASDSKTTAVVLVEQGGLLTVNGCNEYPVIDAGGHGASELCLWIFGGKAVINGGYFYAETDKNNEPNTCVYLSGEHAEVEINGGYFKSDGDGTPYGKPGYHYLVNIQNSVKDWKVVINGGTFENTDPRLGDDRLGAPADKWFVNGDVIESKDGHGNTLYTVVKK